MKIQFLGRNHFIAEMPVLTQVGEEFYLTGSQFGPESIGVVTQVLAQNAGWTRVRIEMLKGRVMSRGQATIQANQAEPSKRRRDDRPEVLSEDIHNEAQLFSSGSTPLQRGGGSAWWDDLDPRPRRGADNVPVNTTEQSTAIHPMTESSVAPVEVLPMLQIADINSHPKGASSQFLSTDDLARSMGKEVSRGGAVGGGRRGSFTNRQVGSTVQAIRSERGRSGK